MIRSRSKKTTKEELHLLADLRPNIVDYLYASSVDGLGNLIDPPLQDQSYARIYELLTRSGLPLEPSNPFWVSVAESVIFGINQKIHGLKGSEIIKLNREPTDIRISRLFETIFRELTIA